MKNMIHTLLGLLSSIIPTAISLVKRLAMMVRSAPDTVRSLRALPWKQIAKSATDRQTVALFYRNNKTYILSTIITVVAVFFILSWTNSFFTERSAKVKAEISLAERTLSTSINLFERSKDIARTQNLLQGGLITYMQDLSQNIDLEASQVRITPRAGTNSTEQLNVRLDGLTLYQFTEMLKDIEAYDNLAILSINIKPQFNDDKKLLITISIAKEVVG